MRFHSLFPFLYMHIVYFFSVSFFFFILFYFTSFLVVVVVAVACAPYISFMYAVKENSGVDARNSIQNGMSTSVPAMVSRNYLWYRACRRATLTLSSDLLSDFMYHVNSIFLFWKFFSKTFICYIVFLLFHRKQFRFFYTICFRSVILVTFNWVANLLRCEM